MLISLAKFRYIEINVETQRLGSSGSMLVGIANRIMYYAHRHCESNHVLCSWEGFAICCSWDVDWQLQEAFHHSVEGAMQHILIFSVPSTNENLRGYGEHELLHEGVESNLRLAFKVISYECERNEIDTARVSLQRFGPQELYERIPHTRDTMCSAPDDGVFP